MRLYHEDEFYRESGSPTEFLRYCRFVLYQDGESEFGRDYDQFALVENAFYPYIRLTKKRGNSHTPCGGSSTIATDGYFAGLTDSERDALCPKIAWGFTAFFLAHLSYSNSQEDYVLGDGGLGELFKKYYERYLELYKDGHNGLKYSTFSDDQKELDYITHHLTITKSLWTRSSPLKAYPILFKYSKDAEQQYEAFIQNRRIMIERKMKKNNCFITEIREPFKGKPYIKVFFLDDSIAIDALDVIASLNTVRKVNITESKSNSHPGNTLTVYPKPMVDAITCEDEIRIALDGFFSSGVSEIEHPKNDAFFDGIEAQVISDLKKARVSIHVAMAWFTNQKIADILVEKFKEGLDVKVVSFDDHTNARFGVDVGSIPRKVIRGTRGGTMHNKFCVIDNQVVLTGSYNWSTNAENKNDENVTVHRDFKNASDFSVEFRRLFESDIN